MEILAAEIVDGSVGGEGWMPTGCRTVEEWERRFKQFDGVLERFPDMDQGRFLVYRYRDDPNTPDRPSRTFVVAEDEAEELGLADEVLSDTAV